MASLKDLLHFLVKNSNASETERAEMHDAVDEFAGEDSEPKAEATPEPVDSGEEAANNAAE